jgi:hypothetical protein
MERTDFERILRQLTGWTGLLYFHLMGEPLLHPGLGEFLELAGKLGFMVNLTTNGSLLADRQDELLASPALRQLNLSLHSQTGAGPELDAYLAGIESFMEKAETAGRPLVSLRLWNYSAGGNGAEADLRQAVEKRFGLELPENPRAVDFRGIRLGPRAYLNIAQSFSWPSLDGPEIGERGFCRGLRDQIGILVDGSVVPCCLDGQGAIGLGNLLALDLDAILESPRAQSVYRGFSERRAVEELCRRCGYRQRFDARPQA